MKIEELINILKPDKKSLDSLRTNISTKIKNLEEYSYPLIELNEYDKERIENLKKITDFINKKPIPNCSFDSNKKYKIDYRKELNTEQLIAVSLINKPLLVIAGAGTGKTRVIVYKVAYLIENKILPEEILLLTFTRKAADEMLDRVKSLIGLKAVGNVSGGTFHSFANQILRKYGAMININQNFTICDAQDSADIISLIKKELFPVVKRKNLFPKKATLQEIISKSRNIQISIDEVVKQYFPHFENSIQEIRDINKNFQQYKKSHNIFDYDDLIECLRNNLISNEIFRKSIKKNINYVLVDEYQDTNNIQREILELLVGNKQRITVVGDDSQSIYSFRGANYQNILLFSQSFRNCEYVKLEENYRSGQEILDFTNEIVSNSKIGFRKVLHTRRYVGTKPIIGKFSDGSEEAQYIADKLLEIQDDNLKYSNFSVLTRASWHSNIIQTEFSKRQIPYIVVGGIRFSEKRHIRDIIAFLRVLLNPIDAIAWHRILKLIDGIGNIRASEIIRSIKSSNGVINFTSLSKKNWYKDVRKYENFYKNTEKKILPSEAIKRVLKFYKALLKQIEYETYEIRLKDIDTLIIIASKYHSLEKFLSDFLLEPRTNRWQDENTLVNKNNEKPVIISTIHSAKGLEWHTVFIPFVLEGLFPSQKSLTDLEDLEEERRVFYVATSRAMENLFITMPSYIQSWNAIFTKPSRFIKEINKRYYKIKD